MLGPGVPSSWRILVWEGRGPCGEAGRPEEAAACIGVRGAVATSGSRAGGGAVSCHGRVASEGYYQANEGCGTGRGRRQKLSGLDRTIMPGEDGLGRAHHGQTPAHHHSRPCLALPGTVLCSALGSEPQASVLCMVPTPLAEAAWPVPAPGWLHFGELLGVPGPPSSSPPPFL